MPHINLLPWREKLRQERQQQFIVALLIGVIFACFVLYGAMWYSDSLLEQQAERNQYLKNRACKTRFNNCTNKKIRNAA